MRCVGKLALPSAQWRVLRVAGSCECERVCPGRGSSQCPATGVKEPAPPRALSSTLQLVWQSHPAGTLLSAWVWESQPQWGLFLVEGRWGQQWREDAVAAPCLTHDNDPSMAVKFPPQTFLLLTPQAVSSQQPTADLSPVCFPNPMFLPPVPVCTGSTGLKLEPQGCGMDCLCRSHFVLPTTDLLSFSDNSPALPTDLSTGEGASWDVGTSPLLFSLLSFVLAGFAGIFVVLLCVQGPLLAFSLFSENCSFVNVFLMLL